MKNTSLPSKRKHMFISRSVTPKGTPGLHPSRTNITVLSVVINMGLGTQSAHEGRGTNPAVHEHTIQLFLLFSLTSGGKIMQISQQNSIDWVRLCSLQPFLAHTTFRIHLTHSHTFLGLYIPHHFQHSYLTKHKENVISFVWQTTKYIGGVFINGKVLHSPTEW